MNLDDDLLGDLLDDDDILQEKPEDYLAQIYEKLDSGQCVFVLGPDLATVDLSKNGNTLSLPIHELVAFKMAAFLKKKNIDFKAERNKDLAYIAMRCHASSLPEVREQQLALLVKSECNKYEQQIPEVYQYLAKIPFLLTINTSFDNYLTQAMGDHAQIAHYNYMRNSSSAIGEISTSQPLVYNLFGTYEEPESLILSKAQQIDFINKLGRNYSKIPNSVRSLMDEETLYIFLGFNTKTWHLPLLFRALDFHRHKAAFYYQTEAASLDVEHIYRDVLEFQLKWESPLELVKQLAEGYENWKAKKKDQAPILTKEINLPTPNLETGKAKVMMMTSNPKNTQALNLNKEIKFIEEELLQAKNRDQFEVKLVLDVNKGTLSRLLENHQPSIVHFSGHGTGDYLLFYGENDMADKVSGQKLGQVLSHHDCISCVLLNACYSESQAEEMAQYIPNIIGTDNAISDSKAHKFAQFFYRSIFAGSTYERAFDVALSDLGIENLDKGAQFVFYKNGERIR
jgi:hypothetical protein